MKYLIKKVGPVLGKILRAVGVKKGAYRFIRGIYRSMLKSEQPSPPKMITIETTTRCNLKCVMCGKNREQPLRPKDFSAELLKKVAPLAERAETIMAHGIGEPLLGPEFQTILALVPKHRPTIVFNTNATNLHGELVERLLAGNVREIVVSLDAATEETYRIIRGYDFKKVVDNVSNLIKERNVKDLQFPIVRLCMTLMQFNIEEAPALVDLAKQIGADGVYFWHLNDGPECDWLVERNGVVFDYQEQLLKNTPEKSNACLRKAFARGKELGIEVIRDPNKELLFEDDGAEETVGPASLRAKTDKDSSDVELSDCPSPWEWLLVYTDGDVRFCCYSDPIASLHDYNSLEDVWNCKAARKFRKLLSRNRVPPQCRNAPCKYITQLAQTTS